MSLASEHSMGETKNNIVLAARHIAKTFGNTHALKSVNFDVYHGQVTTLFGENGAGKSTLMKVLSGVIAPTSGDILLDGSLFILTTLMKPERMASQLFIKS